jgi:hypothetical protein
MKKTKKAQGHIEMILSFVLFLAAVSFIFLYINPFSKNVDNSDEINSAQDIIINQISAEVGRLSVNASSGCYNFSEADYLGPGMNYTEAPGDYPGMYIIYFGTSDVFSNSHPHMINFCSSSNYKLGIFSNQTIISYNKLQWLVYNLGGDYKGTKMNLGINRDFSISSFNLNTGSKINQLSFDKGAPGSIEVESVELPMVIIDENGNSKNIMFNLKVW